MNLVDRRSAGPYRRCIASARFPASAEPKRWTDTNGIVANGCGGQALLCIDCGREAVQAFAVLPAGAAAPPPRCLDCHQRAAAERAEARRHEALNAALDWPAVRALLAAAEATSSRDELAGAAEKIFEWAVRSANEIPADVRTFVERHRQPSRSSV